MSDFFESPADSSIVIWIERRVNEYAPMLEEALQPGPAKESQAAPPNEEALLADLDDRLDRAVELFNISFASRPYGRSGSLRLEPVELDPRIESENPAVRRRALVRGLLAAEIESQGEYRLHRAQNTALAKRYETLGAEFGRVGCFAHAAFAFQRAANVYLSLQDHKAQDRCALAERQMKCRYRPPGLVRIGMRLADLLCGYGYRPGRLLLVMVVQLAVFSGLLTLLSADDFALALHICLVNYLNPLGLSDLKGLPLPGIYTVTVECYAGDFSIAIFSVLLTRKWFRL
ncbi:hypothetical protein [Actinospica robiniae]|uniref:hypothetical protein n=1 Tax=Actinospica robiniae TaxID=304901 RepID=UPI000419E2FA|nr:hypothetical protein [Actinospica robiniae]